MDNLAQFVQENLFFCLSFIFLLAIYIVFELMQSKQAKTSVSAQEAVTAVNRNKGVYIDIRAVEDFQKAHIIGATNITPEELEKSLNKLKKYKERPVIVYSEAANCDKVVATLRKEGFENAFSLNGGLKAWTTAGYPTKTQNK